MRVTLSSYCFQGDSGRQVVVEVSDTVEERFHAIRRARHLTVKDMLEEVLFWSNPKHELLEEHVIGYLKLEELLISGTENSQEQKDRRRMSAFE